MSISASTATQLELLREIRDALADAGVHWWLFGGWAMDAHAGEVTRDHADIEIFLWIDDAEAACSALVQAGYARWAGLYPEECVPFTKAGQEIGLWYITANEEGQIVTPGRWADWPWYPGSFDGPEGRIGDLALPVVSLDGLLDTKTNFANHPHGAPLREKDIGDIERIRQLIARRAARA